MLLSTGRRNAREDRAGEGGEDEGIPDDDREEIRESSIESKDDTVNEVKPEKIARNEHDDNGAVTDESQAISRGAENLDIFIVKRINSGLKNTKIKYEVYSFEMYKNATKKSKSLSFHIIKKSLNCILVVINVHSLCIVVKSCP